MRRKLVNRRASGVRMGWYNVNITRPCRRMLAHRWGCFSSRKRDSAMSLLYSIRFSAILASAALTAGVASAQRGGGHGGGGHAGGAHMGGAHVGGVHVGGVHVGGVPAQWWSTAVVVTATAAWATVAWVVTVAAAMGGYGLLAAWLAMRLASYGGGYGGEPVGLRLRRQLRWLPRRFARRSVHPRHVLPAASVRFRRCRRQSIRTRNRPRCRCQTPCSYPVLRPDAPSSTTTLVSSGNTATAKITVLANPGSKVSFDGIESDQTGTRHSFTTKAISKSSEVRVKVIVDGSSISIGIRGGEAATVDMREVSDSGRRIRPRGDPL